jgi:hypothetical protein
MKTNQQKQSSEFFNTPVTLFIQCLVDTLDLIPSQKKALLAQKKWPTPKVENIIYNPDRY